MTGDPVTRPDVVINLDKPRRLHFDVNAYSSIEEESGQLLGALLQRSGMAATRWMVWGCLLHESPDITRSEVGALLQTHWFQEQKKSTADLWPLINEAIDRSQIFEKTKKKEKGTPKEAPGNAPAEAKAASSASATG